MKRILILSVFFAFLGIGCGAGAPPASIPAPVSSLLAISPPGPTGAVSVTGAPGSVEPFANVQAQNTTQVGPFTLLQPWWERLGLLKNAHAQTTFFVETQADDQGGFSLLIDGQSGDTIAVRDGHVIRNGKRQRETFISPNALLTYEGKEIASWKGQGHTSFRSKDFAEAHPALAAEFTKSQTVRVLRLKKAKK